MLCTKKGRINLKNFGFDASLGNPADFDSQINKKTGIYDGKSELRYIQPGIILLQRPQPCRFMR